MPKLIDFVENADKYGVRMVMPHPREGAIWDIFEVERDDFHPDRPTMRLWRTKQDVRKYGSACLVRNDMLLHLETGVVARVIERISDRECRIEAWCTPNGADPEREKAAYFHWNTKQAQGRWVVWGQAYAQNDKLPFDEAEEVQTGLHLPDHLQKRAMEARFDLFKHPERKPWGAKAGGRVRLSKKQRRKLTRQLRAMAKRQLRVDPEGGQQPHVPKSFGDITDEQIDEKAFFRKKLKHGELVMWHTAMKEKEAEGNKE